MGTLQDLERVCKVIKVDDSHISSPNPQNSLSNSVAPQPRNEPPSVELITGDIREPGVCLRAAQGKDVIVHLAASTGVAPSVADPRFDMEVNVAGTLNLLEAGRQNRVRRFVFASSGAPLGECTPPIHEEMPPHPVSPYGASKLAGEGYCSAYQQTFGVETVILRFGNVYGPLSNHKSSIVAKFIQQTLAGELCEIYGDGHQTRDFIFIADLVEAILQAAIKEVAGETFQIATNKEHTINELAGILAKEMTKHGLQMKLRHGDLRLGDMRRNFSDTSKARRMLGWESLVPLPEGIEKTVAWFLAENRNNELTKNI